MGRIRLTITLDDQVLHKVDTIIDHKKIRNRSHAIEYILGKHFKSKINKALLLAAGESKGDLGIPKVMKEVAGKPVLEKIIVRLRAADITEIIVSLGRFGEKVKDYFGNGEKWGVNIKYINQRLPGSGTGTAIYEARDYFNNNPFLIWYGDVLADIDIQDFVQFHIKENSPITMALTSVPEPSGWGVVRLRGTKIVDLTEKPGKAHSSSYVINAGIYIIESKILDRLSKDITSFERGLLTVLAQQGKMSGYLFEGYWFDTGTEEGYQTAINKLTKS